MFDSLTDKFNAVFRSLSGRGRITEANISDAMREVRKALLEADVNYHVVKQFCKDVSEAALGAEVIKSLHPGQVMIKIVSDELTRLMGPVDSRIYFVSPGPTVLLTIAHSVSFGWRRALVTVAGATVGVADQLFVAAISLASLLNVIAEVFDWLHGVNTALAENFFRFVPFKRELRMGPEVISWRDGIVPISNTDVPEVDEGTCEACERYSDELTHVDGKWICRDCGLLEG